MTNLSNFPSLSDNKIFWGVSTASALHCADNNYILIEVSSQTVEKVYSPESIPYNRYWLKVHKLCYYQGNQRPLTSFKLDTIKSIKVSWKIHINEDGSGGNLEILWEIGDR